jgi:steroid delta-isomerase-like uncharacterized protein/uncharacterized protein (TIGR02246 family)
METGQVQQQERPRRRKIEDLLVGRNKEVVLSLLEKAWSQGDLAYAERVVAEDVVFYDVTSTEPRKGLAAYVANITQYRQAFPDMKLTPKQVIGEGDYVSAPWVGSGTLKGSFMGIAPSGAYAEGVNGYSLYRLAEGKIVEERTTWDVLGWLRQVDTPMPFEAEAAYADQAKGDLSAMLKEFEGAFNRREPKAAAAFFSQDATLISPTGKLAIGKAAIEKVIADDMTTFLPNGSSRFTFRRLRLLSPGLALIDAEHQVTAPKAQAAAGGTMTIHVVGLASKLGGQWRWLDARPHGYLGS